MFSLLICLKFASILIVYMLSLQKLRSFLFVSFILVSFFIPQVKAQELVAGRDYLEGEILVKYKSGHDPDTLQTQVELRENRSSNFTGILKNAQENLRFALTGTTTPENTLEELQTITDAAGVDSSIELSPQKNIYLYKGAEDLPIDQLVARYEQSEAVEYAEPNALYQVFATPNDTDFSKLWGMSKIKASAAWDRSTGSASVIAAVVDTGVDASHPDLTSNIIETRAFDSQCLNGGDGVGHGTHVSGTIGGIGNNGTGVAGVNWKVGILGYCVGGAQGLPLSAVSSAIDAAVAKGAKVINLSLGGQTASPTMQTSIANAVSAGTVVVASAGNTTGPNADVYYPARDPNVITVSALGPNDELAHYSSYGHSVDVAAPGGNPSGGSSTCTTQNCIYSTLPNGRYGSLAGTSMSAPHVTGLVALILSVNPNLSPQQVQSILQDTADDLGTPGRDDKFGYGRINAQAALEKAATGANTTPIPTGNTSPLPTNSTPKLSTAPPIITLPPHQCPDQARTGDYNCDNKIERSDFDKWGTDYNTGNTDLAFFELIRRGISSNDSSQPPGGATTKPQPFVTKP